MVCSEIRNSSMGLAQGCTFAHGGELGWTDSRVSVMKGLGYSTQESGFLSVNDGETNH